MADLSGSYLSETLEIGIELNCVKCYKSIAKLFLAAEEHDKAAFPGSDHDSLKAMPTY